MSTPPFAVTWDYRCPYARNAHEHVVAALEAGADWDVTFLPFSLNQAHVPEGGADVWDDPAQARNLIAMAAGLTVRDEQPDRFLAVHRALFAARHDQAIDLREAEAVAAVITAAGGDGDAALATVEAGGPLATFRKEHEAGVQGHKVFGVPTFIVGESAVFVRLLTRAGDDAEPSRRVIERTIELIGGFPELNEFKHTSIPR